MNNKTKKKPKTTTTNKVKKSNRNEAEQEASDKIDKKTKKRLGPPKFKLNKDGKFLLDKESSPSQSPELAEISGSPDINVFGSLLSQVSNTYFNNDKEITLNFSIAFMHGLKPRDEIEGVLIAQMAGTHNMSMEYLRRSITPNVMPEVVHGYANMACKLLNLWLRQLEALQKYRGKGSKQKMIIEHIHIHKGGQAVVGNIENRPKGEGGNE